MKKLVGIAPDLIQSVLWRAWCRETSYEPAKWSESNPAVGQCTVSALVVQGYLSGSLSRGTFKEGGRKKYHYWNVLPDGTKLDSAKSQFEVYPEMIRIETRDRKALLRIDSVRTRYELLRKRVEALLGGEWHETAKAATSSSG